MSAAIAPLVPAAAGASAPDPRTVLLLKGPMLAMLLSRAWRRPVTGSSIHG